MALAAAKKKKFHDELSAKLKLDHCNSSSVDKLGDSNNEETKLQASKDLVDRFSNATFVTLIRLPKWKGLLSYNIVVKLGTLQENSASIMREVSHRKETTRCHAFVQRKLIPKQLDTKPIRYGNSNEELAIKAYVTCRRKDGRTVNMHKCGLFIDHPAEPWLAASPDIESTKQRVSGSKISTNM